MLETLLIVLAVLLVAGLAWLLFEAVRLYRTTRDWVRIFRSGAESVELVSVEPPQGFVFNREATVALKVVDKAGETKQLDRKIPVPIPQAFLWRVAGRVPSPIRRLAEKRELGWRIWGRRRKRSAG